MKSKILKEQLHLEYLSYIDSENQNIYSIFNRIYGNKRDAQMHSISSFERIFKVKYDKWPPPDLVLNFLLVKYKKLENIKKIKSNELKDFLRKSFIFFRGGPYEL